MSIPTATRLPPSQVLDRCREEGRAALVAYLPVGYPDLATSIEALQAAAAAGADLLEIGIPYSDPVMDGPVIAHAVDAALRGGVRVRDSLTAAAEVARASPATAVLLMTYWNPVLRYGVDRFAADARAHGVGGLITPDLLPDDAGEWPAASTAHGLERVHLVAPSSTDDRVALVERASTGFVYAASTMGVTGARGAVAPAARELVRRTRAAGAARVCVGLGVSTPDQAAEVAEYADGVIVGSALVRALDAGGVPAVSELVADLTRGVRGARAAGPA
ncbi:MAG: tryptophan synthase subunit alpha [Kineosporiaceae bacterium]